MSKVRLKKLDPRMSQQQQQSQQVGGRQPRNFTGGTFMANLDVYDLILRLGQLGAYDSSRRIRGPDGEFVQNTDIAHLIEEAMRPSRVVNGADAFIELLVASKINPDSIANDTIRAKLVQRLENPPSTSPETNNDADDADDGTTVIYEEGEEGNTTTGGGHPATQDSEHMSGVRLERVNDNGN